jgi:hypothetical protein
MSTDEYNITSTLSYPYPVKNCLLNIEDEFRTPIKTGGALSLRDKFD